MSTLRRLLAVSIALVFVGGGNRLTATETLFAGVPVYSVMVTEDSQMLLVLGGANAFTPRNIPCPAAAGPNGCTFRVTVSTVVSSFRAEAYVQVTTSPFMTISPAPVVGIADDARASTPFTMQWVIKNVPAGSSPEVQVIGAITNTMAESNFFSKRTLSIDVFYGLL